MTNEVKQKSIKDKFFDNHPELVLRPGNLYDLPCLLALDGSFRSELLGTVLSNPKSVRQDRTSDVWFYYPYGAREIVSVSRSQMYQLDKGIKEPKTRENKLMLELYRLHEEA